MKNFKLTIEYDGTNYFGWQRQNNNNKSPSVQGVIEDILKKIFRNNITLIGSGRTDTGVHAKGQVANFKVDTRLGPIEIKNAINAYLPEDVSVCDAKEVPLNFHSRFSAKRKWYRYTISIQPVPSVFDRLYSFSYVYGLDLAKMKLAARVIVGKHDFSGVAPGEQKNKVREIYKLDIKGRGNFVYIDVVGNGFLYKMVRRLVGLLIDIGRSKIDVKDIKDILKGKGTNYAVQTAPAKGLCLMEVI